MGRDVAPSGRPAPTRRIDVFNGDADGMCALHQLRLAAPADTELVTGVKRDIALLERVAARLTERDCAGAELLVLDVSLDRNAAPLRRLLAAGASVDYFDHHAAAQAFAHPGLRLFWDDCPDCCTSILVDRYLDGRYRPWAVAAAFGDNLAAPARALAARAGLDGAATAALEQLGQLLNYNAYGDCVADLHICPERLYRALGAYADPLAFIADSPCHALLLDGYRADCARLHGLRPHWQRPGGAVYVLPAAPWARRVSGVLANRLAAAGGAASFAILSCHADGHYVVSVRSGAPAERSAHGLCEQFPGGGGRRAAAGINHLPAAEVERFIERFRRYFALPEQHHGH